MSKMSDIDITIQDIQQLLANEPHATQVYTLEAVLLQVKLRRICGECEEYLPDDERVVAGMKCFNCTYVTA